MDIVDIQLQSYKFTNHYTGKRHVSISSNISFWLNIKSIDSSTHKIANVYKKVLNQRNFNIISDCSKYNINIIPIMNDSVSTYCINTIIQNSIKCGNIYYIKLFLNKHDFLIKTIFDYIKMIVKHNHVKLLKYVCKENILSKLLFNYLIDRYLLDICCENGYTNIIKLLQKYFTVLIRHFNISVCCENNNLHTIKYLYNHYEDCEIRSHYSTIQAYNYCNLDIIKFLHLQNMDISTLQGINANRVCIRTVKYLYENMSFTFCELESYLTLAISENNLDVVMYFYTNEYPLKRYRKHISKTILENGYMELLKYLHHKIDIDYNNHMIFACRNGHYDMVKFICDDNDKFTCTVINDMYVSACESGHLDIAKYIDDKYDCVMKYSKAFKLACLNGKLNIVAYLHKSLGVDFSDNMKALGNACSQCHLEVIKYLNEEIKLNTYSGELIFNYYEKLYDVIQYLHNNVNIDLANSNICEILYDDNQGLFSEQLCCCDNDQRSFSEFPIGNCDNISIIKYLHENNILPNDVFIRTYINKLNYECIDDSHTSMLIKYFHETTIMSYNDLIKYQSEIIRTIFNSNDIKTLKYLHEIVGLDKNYFIRDNLCYVNRCTIEIIKYLHEIVGLSLNDFNLYGIENLCGSDNLDMIKYMHKNLGLTKELCMEFIPIACECGSYYIIKYLHEEMRFTKDDFMTNNNTAYNLANKNDEFDVIKYLCDVVKIDT